MENKIRSFIAVEIPEGVQAQIGQLQQKFKNLQGNIKLVKSENIHLTLKFLGDIDQSQLNKIKEKIDDTAKISKKFEIKICGIGVFPKLDFPRIIWVGIEDDEKHIEKIYQNLEDGLSKIGFEKEKRAFHSHLTIARIKYLKDKVELKKILETTQFIISEQITVNEISLFKSTLTPKGAIYTLLYKRCFSE